MKLTHWKLGTVLLGVLILLCLVWWPEVEAPDSLQPVITSDTAPAVSEVTPPLPPVRYDPDCVTCPPGVATGEKRSPSENKMEATMDCWQFLKEAAVQGNPHPDTSHLEDCYESPLFHANTADQIHALLDAGADLNIRGQWGHTPLYRQMHKAVTRPSEERYALILAMLEAGADPWIEDDRGESPYDAARKMMGTGSMVKLQMEERLIQETASRGLTEEQMFAENPALAKTIEEMRQAPDFAARTLAALMGAMKRTDPNPMRNNQ